MTSQEDLIEITMLLVGLTRPQAVEYLMERQYNQLNHEQAMAAIKEKSWLWSQEGK